MDREQKIIRTSILGIGVNLILVAFKAVVGCKSNLHTGIQNISGFHNDGRFMTFLIMRAAAASCRHVINYAVRLAGHHEC